MDMVLELVAHLDWFERVDELARWLTGTKSWRVAVRRDCGVSGQQIEDLLKAHGVKVWGRNFNRTHLYFRVKLQQARWTGYLLWRQGIMVSSPPPRAA